MPEVESVDWRAALNEVAAFVRKKFDRQLSFEDDGDVSPQTVALRDAFYAFPYRADVFVMDTNEVPTPFGEGRWWTVIKHDFTQPNSQHIRFHGTFTIQGLWTDKPLALSVFGLSGIDFQDLRIRGWPDPDGAWYIQVVPYLIFEQPEKYADDLFMWLWIDSFQFSKQFLKETKYDEVYRLTPGPPMTDEELSQRDPDHLFRVGPPTLSKLHNDTRELLLIPQVPEDVRRTFKLSKLLHTYSYYEDHFYTVAAHYAFLAVEAAVFARWSITLPKMVTLECGGDKHETWHPTHTKIASISRAKWPKRFRSVLVDGRPFPHSTNLLLKWFGSEKIVTKWLAHQLRLALDSRNYYSHLEHAPVAWSCLGDLRFSATLINTLFHSVPLAKA